MRSVLANTFWILALAVILLFAFFWVIGALKPAQAMELTWAVIGLVVLWAGHALWSSRRGGEDHRDPRVIMARERRGF